MIAWLVETLIVTSALMLLVLALRDPVRQQFGAKVAYALWLLPALRMVKPPIAWLIPDNPALAPIARHSGALAELIHARITQFDAAPVVTAVSGGGHGWAVLMLGALWLAGALAFLLWQTASYRRFTRSVIKDARVRRSPKRGIRLLASPRVSGPMAFGLTRRFIVFPHDALMRFDVEEHAMALAHELAHHRRGDLLANAAALVFLALHWCNPIAWIAHRAFRADQEMACDADVIGAIRDQGLGHAYGRALVKCASGRDSLAICHLTTVDRLKRRLSMLSRKSPSPRRRLVGLALAGTLVLSGLAMTASGQGMAAQVGEKVSRAIPETLPLSMPAFTDATAAVAAEHAAALAEHEARLADHHAALAEHKARVAELAAIGGLPPEPPAPPEPAAPPALSELPTPPEPPAPPAPPALASAFGPIPRTIPLPSTDQSRYRHDYRVDRRSFADIPTPAEIEARVPIIEVQEGTGCAGAREFVNTSEETVSVDGKRRQRIKITICGKDIHRQARAEAMQGLREARHDIAGEPDLSDATRSRILADLDRQIARLSAGRD